MAETITIPSPSAFLRKSPPPSDPPPTAKPTAPKHARSSSAEAKKKAARKSVGNVPATEGSVVKPKQSKSRNGCVTCKAKRLKCGEEKPGCQQCARRKVECGGYKKDFKWRPFEETNVKINLEKPKRGNSPKQSSAPASTISSKRPSPEKIPRSVDDQDRTSHERRVDSVIEDRGGPPKDRFPQILATRREEQTSNDKRHSVTPPEAISAVLLPPLVADISPSENTASTLISPEFLQLTPPSQFTTELDLSPTLTETLLPFNIDDPTHQDFVSFQLPEGFQMPEHSDSDNDRPQLNGDDENDELEGYSRDDDAMLYDFSLLPTSRPRTPPSPGLSDSINDVFNRSNYIFPQPQFVEDSPEMLAFRFDRLTCGILSIMDGPTENPWRNLIWPLAQQSSALYHAITAMTAFHSSLDIPQLRLVGHEHKAASIRYIQEGIRDNSMTIAQAIATALALGFAESWDQHTSTGNSHIKGAQVLVRRALENHQRTPLTGVDLDRLKFLVNAWVYMDVIARLTSVDCDESNEFDNTFLFSSNPNEAPSMVMGDRDEGFGIDFGMPIDARLDPLMGCANTLFPLIGRVANLVRKVCRSQNNSPAIISQANDLKLALECWDAPAFIERPEDPSTDVEHTLQTAEAYRWATLLHLHQSVPELPSLSRAELAQRVLQYLATVPPTSRSIVVQTYPLMVAGCEAMTAEDRQWVRQRWAAMYLRMRIGNVEKSATVTEEVWRRRDAYEAKPSANRRLVATADLQRNRNLQRNRQRSQPFVRTPTGSFRLGDPGSTGVVFSYVETEDVNDSEEEDHKRRARDRRNGRDPRMRHMDPAYTVRGHLHWVGVMWDWGWEILLG